MARKHEAVDWLNGGNSPSKIAAQMKLNVGTVMGYLYNQVGEGEIRRSDIVFSIDRRTRDGIESLISSLGTVSWYRIYREAGGKIDPDDLRVYLRLRDARLVLGDMYEFLREVEVNLHALIKKTLVSTYGTDKWWRTGVPKLVRIKCTEVFEDDDEPGPEAYCYTNFIDLGKILEHQWHIFKDVLPKKLYSNRPDLIARLRRLNHIRNAVMHPVRGIRPTEEDFGFVRSFRSDLEWKVQS
jgi:hypothetical protein